MRHRRARARPAAIPAVRDPQADGPRPRPGRAAPDAAARRAGRRPQRRGDPGSGPVHHRARMCRPAGRAPHGPGHGRLPRDPGARLRQAGRVRYARPDPGRSGGHRGLPRRGRRVTGLLVTEQLTAGYGAAPVLHDIDLTVEPGQIVAVLGANGAGKTTLLRTLSGLVRPTRGRVWFDSEDLRGVRVEQTVRRGMAHVPEGGGIITELTVEENLRLGGLWRTAKPDLDEVYQLFEPLARRPHAPRHQLSGGGRQMLAPGRAPVGRPRRLVPGRPALRPRPP